MEPTRLDEILTAAEGAIAQHEAVDLRALGFWSAVAAVKSDTGLRDSFAARIAAIDQAAFQQWVLVCVGLRIGTWIMLVGTAISLGVIGAAYSASEPWNGLALLLGTGGLLVTTHGLAHLLVGSMAGIRFTHWFIGSLVRPQPGVKIDYESYLRAPARRRAQMHAAGAVTTKLLPFLMLGAAGGMGAPAWAWLALIALGVIQLVTDAVWSVKSSDWKKYRREMQFARNEG